MIRARSHRFPDMTDKYIDTTYYDEDDNTLDVGWQRLKIFHVKAHPELSTIQTLFIDHNDLKVLPDPSTVPRLTTLNCSYNKLTTIPFYPKLVFLNCAGNSVTELNPKYELSNLKYVDVSFNKGFKLNIHLKLCKQLFINDCELTNLNLDLVPNVLILDCGNNLLTSITNSEKFPRLIELNIQDNKISKLCPIPSLTRLIADDNLLEEIVTYPNLLSLYVCDNRLKKIAPQPKLRKLIAQHNQIESIGEMSNLKAADLGYNLLTKIPVFPVIEYLSVHFNPLTKVVFLKENLINLKEIQINYDTYSNIHDTYHNYFDFVSVQTDPKKLKEKLIKLKEIFNGEMIEYIGQSFMKINFKASEESLFKISLKLYWDYLSPTGYETVGELIETKEFKYIYEQITKLYHRTLIITLYFNGHI
jgi:hypothetical protein